MHTGRCACGGGESPMLGEPPPPSVAYAPAGPRLHALPRLCPLPAPPPPPLPVPPPPPPPAGCFRREAVGEVTCGEAVGEVTWLLPPPPAATWSKDLEKR